MPFELARFCAAAGRRGSCSAAANDARTRAASSATASGTSTTSEGDDDVIAFAQHAARSEEHTSELQSHHDLVCRLLLEKNKKSHVDLGRQVQHECLARSRLPSSACSSSARLDVHFPESTVLGFNAGNSSCLKSCSPSHT